MARYQGPWIESIPPTMHTWGGKNYIESPKMPKNENKDNLSEHKISVHEKSRSVIISAAEKIFDGKCPLPLPPHPLKLIRESNKLADLATSKPEVLPCWYFNYNKCGRDIPLHRIREKYVLHYCLDCHLILGQKNIHQRTKVPCPFREMYHDEFNEHQLPNFGKEMAGSSKRQESESN